MLLLFQGTQGDGSVWGCCLIFVAVIVIALVSKHNADKRKAAALVAAHDAYRRALARLKADPTNADLRQQTLHLGRQYSALTRQDKNVTIYDEMALMNDINAACAAAATQGPARQGQGRDTAEARLGRLSDLRTKGLIDEEEYAERRRKILDEI